MENFDWGKWRKIYERIEPDKRDVIDECWNNVAETFKSSGLKCDNGDRAEFLVAAITYFLLASNLRGNEVIRVVAHPQFEDGVHVDSYIVQLDGGIGRDAMFTTYSDALEYIDRLDRKEYSLRHGELSRPEYYITFDPVD